MGSYSRFLGPFRPGEFGKQMEHFLGLYDDQINQVQLNLLDSHDTPRFLTSVGQDKQILKLGILFLSTFVGAPCIFYGDEIGLTGRGDPDCRKAFPWDHGKWDMDLLDYYKNCIQLRKEHSALRRGAYRTIFTNEQVFAFARVNSDERILVFLNISNQSQNVNFNLSGDLLSNEGYSLMFDSTHFQVNGTNLEITLPAKSGNVLMG